jgi:hypothetical protein
MTLFHGAWAALIALAGWLVIEALATHARPAWLWRAVYWTPRLAALLFAALISLMALDVFGEGADFWDTALAFLLHLVPGALLLVGCALAWRWEWIGAVAFIGWGLWYLAVARGFVPSVYVEVAGLPLALGLLFWLNWHYRAERPSPLKPIA